LLTIVAWTQNSAGATVIGGNLLERPIVTQSDFPDDKTLSIFNVALSPTADALRTIGKPVKYWMLFGFLQPAAAGRHPSQHREAIPPV
jgi:hypothetical protein